MHRALPRHVFALVSFCLLGIAPLARLAAEPVRYARFEANGKVAYGVVEGDRIRALDGDLFGEHRRTDQTYSLQDVKLLVPVDRPSKVLALAGNYKSHLGGENAVTTVVSTTKTTTTLATGETTSTTTTTTDIAEPGKIPAKFQIPQVFFKPTSCLVADGEAIVIPPGTNDVHYEAELVIVIGRRANNVSEEQALDYVLGVTCGNDVSARDWQKADVQWWRAKGCDTFGPVGPFIVSGIDYGDLDVTLRLNGKKMQKDSTSAFIQDVPRIVSVASQHVTLEPGDLIFTGTPGETTAMKPGDRVEVEIEGVGTLTNTVSAAK